MVLARLAIFSMVAILLSACSQVDRRAADEFTTSGELIALSGGDGGAAYACFTCHGIHGRGNGAGTPRLAGLDRGYMAAQLAAYAGGRRQHPEMATIAGKLSLAQQDAVSAYYAAKPFAPDQSARNLPTIEAARLYHHGDPVRGLASCASCHGERGEGLGPANPPLGAQPAAYLAEQLDLWRAGKRRSDPQNVMLRISQALSRQQSLDLAAYAAHLPGDLPHPKSRATSPAEHRDGPKNDASGPPLRAEE
jgi:cytochrome c553